MAEYESLNEAMIARDDLAEAEIRYRLLAETFEAEPKLRANLCPALERTKVEIVRLRAISDATTSPDVAAGKVVAFDPARFKKTVS